jgi:hypothetical protein
MGTLPEVLITGLAGSGTTWMIRIFQELGFDLGEPLFSLDDRKGLEWMPLLNIKLIIDQELIRHSHETSFDHPAYIPEDIIEQSKSWYKKKLESLDCPRIVKVPGLELSGPAIFSVLRPRTVILMHRPLRAWARSRDTARTLERIRAREANPEAAIGASGLVPPGMFASGAVVVGMTIDILEEYGLDYLIIDYSKAVRDCDYLYHKLYSAASSLGFPYSQLFQAHKLATDSRFIDYSVKQIELGGPLSTGDSHVEVRPPEDISRDLLYARCAILAMTSFDGGFDALQLESLNKELTDWADGMEEYYKSGDGCALYLAGSDCVGQKHIVTCWSCSGRIL